ncbi:MAG: tRNA pseudouridine(38-40) synthase TruA [Planctomycetales bacterium]|nr:tRNA pseudouridine(38-40) synthase TruA [Planctomycetales bacterium]
MKDAPLRTIRLLVAYEGTRFLGWQRQKKGPTVQQAIEEAVARVTGERVAVHGAGRTDAGVHAAGQVAHVRVRTAIPSERIPHALNANLPEDVRVLEASDAPDGFHARFGARAKVYAYTVRLHPHENPLDRAFVHRVSPPLDVAAMREGAAALLGTHDFGSFATHGSEGPAASRPSRIAGRGSVRTLARLDLAERGDYLTLIVEGDGFLRNMVRTIAGTLLEVGRGRLAPSAIPGILAARDRRRAGPTAPARGLCLLAVRY